VIPSGGLNDRESEIECVIREAQEEINLEVEVERLLFNMPSHPEGVYPWRKTFSYRPTEVHAPPGIEPEAEAAERYAITEIRRFDLRDDSDWEASLVSDPFTYLQLTLARKRCSYLPEETRMP
jgi:8-oxo-dGTP pyrophosphatase MutT (NUDIX family)